MNKKELSEAIEESIVNGFWKPIFYFLIGAFIIELFFLGLMFYSNYRENKCLREGTCQPQVMVAEQSCFPLENLHCRVVIGNDTHDFWNTGYFSICGYQEANAFYEQIKPKIEIDVREDRILYHRNSRIKYLECE